MELDSSRGLDYDHDHIDGDKRNNDVSNCQALWVVAHTLKTRDPGKYQVLVGDVEERVKYLKFLLGTLQNALSLLSQAS